LIAKEKEAEILRLYHAERWRVGTIASQLGLHHTTVQRVLQQAGSPAQVVAPRPSIAEPFIGLIVEVLGKYPKLSARRLYEMACERGYKGGPDHFRRVVARPRPRPVAEAYQRLSTLPGEEAQVDWAHFGQATVGQAKRKLYAFVLVLSWSRRAVVRFYFGSGMPYFIAGHVDAFTELGGVPRRCLYDNLKSAVLERQGDIVRFNPQLIELSAHYRFEPRPVAIARGNEKGRVERVIRYLRSSFFAAREWSSLADLNHQATVWAETIAVNRPWPQDKLRTVREIFSEEQSTLLPLPDVPFPSEERMTVGVGKTPYVRFDLNDYSVPHTHVRRTLTVLASLTRVRVLDGTETIAEHDRCWDRHRQLEDPQHVAALSEAKRSARRARGLDRLQQAAPSCRAFLQLAVTRGANLGRLTQQLIELLDAHGAADFEEALVEILERDRAHLGALQHVLDRNRATRGLPPPVTSRIAPARHAELVVKPHDLGTYDQLDRENCDE
jgi:transposase